MYVLYNTHIEQKFATYVCLISQEQLRFIGGNLMNEERIRMNRLKRKQQVRNQIVIIVATICIVVILAILTGSFLSKASNSQQPTAFKYYTSVQVKAGDTLWNIAQNNLKNHNTIVESTSIESGLILSDSVSEDMVAEYVKEVVRTNHLKEETIHAGQYIVIPYYSQEFIQ